MTLNVGELLSKSKWSIYLRSRILLLRECYQWILLYMYGSKKLCFDEKKPACFTWHTQVCFLFGCFSRNFPSLSMFQHQLSLMADFPFGVSSVKSVYADLKAFQVHMRDTGNSQVKGEQLHRSSVGMK